MLVVSLIDAFHRSPFRETLSVGEQSLSPLCRYKDSDRYANFLQESVLRSGLTHADCLNGIG